MTFFIGNDGPVPRLETEIDRLRGLIQALEDIRRGRHPDRSALATCPRLHDWQVVQRPVPCLAGIMLGHPGITDGRLGLTTDLWVFAPALGYARTLSRTYALGEPGASGTNRRH